jgi:carbon-monoxide dehydrogenase small subunit
MSDAHSQVASEPRHAVTFTLNGTESAELVGGGMLLLDLLRNKLGDMSSKAGCRQGGCGACSVIIDGQLRLSCLTLASECDGTAIVTAAGLADGNQLHPLQRAFIDRFASQCGFCTPGMLMAAQALLDSNPLPTRADVIQAISGNICRCTGYAPIIEAILDVAHPARATAVTG